MLFGLWAEVNIRPLIPLKSALKSVNKLEAQVRKKLEVKLSLKNIENKSLM
jgi:hypothetical protein